jgi:hypothetical protein
MLRVMAKTLLDKVRAKLSKYAGAALVEVSEKTNISYDTLLRIRESRTDPPFGKIQTLAEFFWPGQYKSKDASCTKP